MDDKAYEQFVAAVVRGLSFSNNAQVFTNKRYHGVRQPGAYEIDVSCEVSIDNALFFLIIVECKNWSRPIDRPQIQKLIQTRDAISAHKAAFASPVGYSDEAVKVAKANGVALWVVAEAIFETLAGGGMAALSLSFRISNYLRTLFYEAINYNSQYHLNVLNGRPNLIPISWLAPNTVKSLSAYSRYRAAHPQASAYDPIISELFLHALVAKPETNTLTQAFHHAITRIHETLRRAGLTARQGEVFLRDFAIPMVTEGLSIPDFFSRLTAFDKTIPHATTSLLAPLEWIEKHRWNLFIYSTEDNDHSSLSLRNNIVWANAAWLLRDSTDAT